MTEKLYRATFDARYGIQSVQFCVSDDKSPFTKANELFEEAKNSRELKELIKLERVDQEEKTTLLFSNEIPLRDYT